MINDEDSRWKRLEIDDDDTALEKERSRRLENERLAREAEAVAKREAEDLARREAQARREADALRAERERLEEGERVAQLHAARRERRSARTKTRRRVKSAKDQVIQAIHDLTFNKYPRDRERVISQIVEAAENAGFVMTGEVEADGNREVHYMEDEDGKTVALVISTYQMPSGNWEITSYLW